MKAIFAHLICIVRVTLLAYLDIAFSSTFCAFYRLINKPRKASGVISQMLKALFKVQRTASQDSALSFRFFS